MRAVVTGMEEAFQVLRKRIVRRFTNPVTAARHVLVAGLGGVGSFAAEAIARAGVGAITLVDHDHVDPSNINRQLIALHSTLNQPKSDVMSRRIEDINPATRVVLHQDFLQPSNISALLQNEPVDYVLDCIDSITSKAALVVHCQTLGIPVISAMGAGGRQDVDKVYISRLHKTHSCPLGREMRKHIKKLQGRMNYPVIFSTEMPVKGTAHQPAGRHQEGRPRSVNGTISYLPGLFGLMMAGYVIQDLLQPDSN